MQEKKLENKYFILYGISFVIVYMIAIFWLDKEAFDLEFKVKETTTALIYKLDKEEIVEELNDGKEVNIYDVDYLEYEYFVDGKKYKYGGQYRPGVYSISDKIVIEYVKDRPSISKIKGEKKYRFNYFIRNLFMYSIYAVVLTLSVLELLKICRRLCKNLKINKDV